MSENLDILTYMDENAVPQKMGRKTFWIFLLQKSIGAIILFVIMFVFFILSAVGPANFFPNIEDTAGAAFQAFFILGLLISTFLFIVAAALAIIITWLEYKNYTYTLGEHALEVSRGIISKENISIPYHHIEDINIEQSMFYQMIGACRLVILTAGHGEGGDQSEGVLPTIDLALGKEILQIILERSNVQDVVNVPAKNTIDPTA